MLFQILHHFLDWDIAAPGSFLSFPLTILKKKVIDARKEKIISVILLV